MKKTHSSLQNTFAQKHAIPRKRKNALVGAEALIMG
jgi:hypothetical protein